MDNAPTSVFERLPTLPAAGGHHERTNALGPAARQRTGATGRRSRLRADVVAAVEYVVLAVVAYVPQLRALPGALDADTKSYLYFDPGRFVRQSATMWDPTVGLGTVTHQQLGYLFPMGPFFWLAHNLGVATWVTQRLWMGSILLAAGAGVLYLARVFGLSGPGRPVAALCFMVSPYFLQYAGHESVILLPWAGLPWMVALTARGVERGGWRYPAAFALVVLVISGINATSLLYVGLAPALWVLYAVFVTKQSSWRAALAAVLRIGVLSAVLCAWWIAGLGVEGAYGLNVLKYTETIPAIASTSLSSEVLRGLGYWYYYGGDNFGPWMVSSVQLTQELSVLALSFAVPALAFVGAAVTRWSKRAYLVILVVIGIVLAVGTHPYASPTPVGAVLKAFMTRTSAGLALRSTDRATPLVVLGIAMLLGSGVTALGRWPALRRWQTPVGVLGAAGAAAVVVLANPAMWNGTTLTSNILEPAAVPGYVKAATKALDGEHRASRVLAIPGQNFAYYRYGNTSDPLYPALLTRPFVTRQQQVLGSLPSLDLLYALDSPLQQGTLDPDTIAPLARLMSVGDVLVQNDLAYELYNQPSPEHLWKQLDPPPPGLSAGVPFGTVTPSDSLIADVNEQALADTGPDPVPALLETMAVAHPRPLVRAESASTGLAVDGDDVGLADAAQVGLLNTDDAIMLAGTLDTDTPAHHAAVDGNATVVVTDTNAKQGFRWNTLTDNAGYIETAGAGAPTDPTDVPLDLFPSAPPDAQTTATIDGVASVQASSYGSDDTFEPQYRPVLAIDGNPATAWATGAAADPDGQWWQVTTKAPITTDHVTLTQPQVGDIDRWITSVTLRFDGQRPLKVALGAPSRSARGQTITFSRRTFRTLRIVIDTTTAQGNSPVGFAQVSVGAVRATEVIDMPQDLLRSMGTASRRHRLVLLFTRLRGDPAQPGSDAQVDMDRSFWLPTPRTFTLSGTARIDAMVPSATLATLLSPTGPTTVDASSRLPGDLNAGPAAAFDGNPATAWTTAFGSDQVGQWVSVTTPTPVTFDQLNLQVIADGRHSVPTALRISTEDGSVNVKLPSVTDGRANNATVTMPLRFATLTGRHITITVTAVRAESTKYFGLGPLELPIAVDEVGIPGVTVSPPPATLPTPCRSDLLSIDGRPVSVRVLGTTTTALAGQALDVSLCGPDAGGLRLGAGTHRLQSADGAVVGIDLDQLDMSSAPDLGGASTADGSARPPTTHVVTQSTTAMTVHVAQAAAPFWLVLGQSLNAGWQATVAGRSLGSPTLVDGYANGWLIDPTTPNMTVSLTWVPQRGVDDALVVSAAGAVVCVGLVMVPRRRRRRRREHEDPDAPVLVSPLHGAWSRPSWPASVVVTVMAAALGAAVAGTLVAVVVGVAALVTARLHRGRGAMTLGAVALVVAAGVYVVIHQGGSHVIAGGGWPAKFEPADVLTWMAVALLGADVLVTWILRRAPRERRRRPPPT